MDELSNFCRACLKKAEDFTYFIYTHISPKQYSYCTSIEVKHYDILPKSICNDCFKKINEFIEFKSKCMRSEIKLLQFLRDLQDEPTPELGIKYSNENSAGTEVKNENRQCAKTEIDDAEEDRAEIVLRDSHFDDSDDLKSEIDDANENKAEEALCDSNFDDTDVFKTQIDDDKDGTGEVLNNSHHDGPLTDVSETTVEYVAPRASITNPRKSNKNNTKTGILKRLEYVCEQCNRTFVYETTLVNHKREVHNIYGENKALECEKCKKTCTSRSALRLHIKRNHMHAKEVTCQICSKVCKTLRIHMRHQKTHEKQKRVCDECGMVLKNDATFKKHLQTHMKNRKRDYPCSYCDKMYINKESCSKHIARRHSTKQFICDYCDFVFTEKNYLVRHIMLHEGTHPKYKCDICSRSLASRTSLLHHKRKHTGEKPFSCNHCSKSFSNKMWLVEHERVHTGEKPYECVVCAQRFSRRGSRNRHMKVHNMWIGCKQRPRGPNSFAYNRPGGVIDGNTMTP